MTLACPPLLRFALHALLALAVLLQASVAVAMHASAAAGSTGDTPAPLATESAATLPPCHALAAAVVEPNPAAAADCCGDSALGESCRWACAQALGVTSLLVLTSEHRPTAGPGATPILPAVHWTAQSPLRPPIG